jgi:DNA-binding NarL/FixJ family response regulator
MGLNVLIAEPCELLRVGLRTIFFESTRVSNIYEAATKESLKTQLRSYTLDLVVINQVLVTDVMLLPRGKFAILTSEPDIAILKAAYRQGMRGYLSENVSAELLRMVLHPSGDSFLMEPTLAPWFMECLFGNTFSSIKEELLTPREREIIHLLREGLDRPTIAKHLCIAETTLKTHIKNIAHKRETEQNARAVVSSHMMNGLKA